MSPVTARSVSLQIVVTTNTSVVMDYVSRLRLGAMEKSTASTRAMNLATAATVSIDMIASLYS